MERNCDEIISDMMRSIDQNVDTIRRQQAKLNKHSRVLDRHSAELTRQVRRNEKFFEEHMDRLKGSEAIQSNHLEMIIHTAELLDRIVRVNKLKV